MYPARRSASPKESDPDPVPERRSRAPSLEPSLNDRPLDPNPLCLSPIFWQPIEVGKIHSLVEREDETQHHKANAIV